MKIKDDKYYTPPDLASYITEKTIGIIGEQNITEYLEPSAGSGVFLDYINKPFLAYDIKPEDDRILEEDFLKVNLEYKKGRCIIGNPPYGSKLNLAQKFFKKSVILGDYIAFILPISQLWNTNSMYEFDLIHSEDLGFKMYSGRKLHCCFNIYKRPKSGELNKKKKEKLEDVTIIRQDSKRFKQTTNFDLILCYWGNGSAGKIVQEEGQYSAEYKIIVNNKNVREKVIHVLSEISWWDELNCIAMLKIQQFHIIKVLKKYIPEIK